GLGMEGASGARAGPPQLRSGRPRGPALRAACANCSGYAGWVRRGQRLAATRSLRSGARVAPRAPLRRLRVAAKRFGPAVLKWVCPPILSAREVRMSSRVILLVAVLVGVAPAAAAAQSPLDPELTTPYHWRVVVKAQPHPLVTPTFRGQLRR